MLTVGTRCRFLNVINAARWMLAPIFWEKLTKQTYWAPKEAWPDWFIGTSARLESCTHECSEQPPTCLIAVNNAYILFMMSHFPFIWFIILSLVCSPRPPQKTARKCRCSSGDGNKSYQVTVSEVRMNKTDPRSLVCIFSFVQNRLKNPSSQVFI